MKVFSFVLSLTCVINLAAFDIVHGDVIKMNDGRSLNATKHWEENGVIFIEMYGGIVTYEKSKVKEIISDDRGAKAAEWQALKNSAQKSEYDSEGAVVMLSSGKNFQANKTYEKDGLVVCQTAQGATYLKKEEILQIIKTSNNAAAGALSTDKAQNAPIPDLAPRHDITQNGVRYRYIGEESGQETYQTENGAKYRYEAGQFKLYTKGGGVVTSGRGNSNKADDANPSRQVSRPPQRYDDNAKNWRGARSNR